MEYGASVAAPWASGAGVEGEKPAENVPPETVNATLPWESWEDFKLDSGCEKDEDQEARRKFACDRAGIDTSYVPEAAAILPPRSPEEYAARLAVGMNSAATFGPGSKEDDAWLVEHFARTAETLAGGTKVIQFHIHPDLLCTTKTSPKDENAMYVSLKIPVDQQASSPWPVMSSMTHMTITYCAVFDQWSDFWRFRCESAALLAPRTVRCIFIYANERKWVLYKQCELFTLGVMLRELVQKYARELELKEDFAFHITWHKGA